jgi:hypothetical protein
LKKQSNAENRPTAKTSETPRALKHPLDVKSPARRANPPPPKGGSGTSTSIQHDFLNRADRPEPAYFRAAQAYMLISMPTDTSTIFGVFQAIQTSMDFAHDGATRN